MLGADIAVVQAAGLFDRQLDYLLGSRGETDLTAYRLLAPADDELDRGAYFAKLNAKVVEDLGCYTISFSDEAKKQMLSPNVVVVEPLCFLLGKRQNSARSLSKFVKSVCHIVY
jgi:hypothetical protein